MTGLIGAPLNLIQKRAAKVLIIDDEPNVLSVLYSLLSTIHRCKTATSAVEALEYLREETYDLVLSDIMMPGMSGLELLAEITRLSRDTVVILISGNLNIQSAIEAMRRGAFDYVTKPFDLCDVETAVARALRHQSLVRANQQYEQHLEDLVGLRTNELTIANTNLNTTLEKLYFNYRATLRALAAALEARDVETKGHSDRVVSYCVRLGKQIEVGPHHRIDWPELPRSRRRTGDVRQPRQPQPLHQPFQPAEDKRLVLADGAAGRESELVPLERRRRADIEKVGRVHDAVAEELEPGTVWLVRAGFRDDTDYTAHRAAVVG